jgi:hypothetical protein
MIKTRSRTNYVLSGTLWFPGKLDPVPGYGCDLVAGKLDGFSGGLVLPEGIQAGNGCGQGLSRAHGFKHMLDQPESFGLFQAGQTGGYALFPPLEVVGNTSVPEGTIGLAALPQLMHRLKKGRVFLEEQGKDG